MAMAIKKESVCRTDGITYLRDPCVEFTGRCYDSTGPEVTLGLDGLGEEDIEEEDCLCIVKVEMREHRSLCQRHGLRTDSGH